MPGSGILIYVESECERLRLCKNKKIRNFLKFHKFIFDISTFDNFIVSFARRK